MSLILEALRKLDREKSSRRHGAVDIAAEILRPDLPRPRKRMWISFTAILVTAVATAAITYAVISKTSPPAAIDAAAPTVQLPPVSLSREPARNARDDRSRGRAKMQAPVEIKRPAETEKPTESIKQPAEVKVPLPPPSEEKTTPEVVSKETPIVPGDFRKPAEQPPRKSALTPASLKLSGIVWSPEPSKRLAVINGMVTTEGYVFEGVKVVEIFPDHVALLLNDQPFELSINK